MTSKKRHRRDEVLHLKHALRMAQRRRSMIHYSLTTGGDNPALSAELEMLEIQIRSMQRELQGLSEAA